MDDMERTREGHANFLATIRHVLEHLREAEQWLVATPPPVGYNVIIPENISDGLWCVIDFAKELEKTLALASLARAKDMPPLAPRPDLN
jgi:hypothetical protein